MQLFNQDAAIDQETNIPSFHGEFVQYAADDVEIGNSTSMHWPECCQILVLGQMEGLQEGEG